MAKLLQSRGAVIRLEILHLEGALDGNLELLDIPAALWFCPFIQGVRVMAVLLGFERTQMGNVIARNAGAERIIDVVSKTLTRAEARGGQVQVLVEARLSALHAALAALEQQLNQARTADDALHAALMARDNESDLEIGAVVDEIWNALGRPAQSIDYDLIVGSGKKAWTDGDPVKQPHSMGALAANIRQSSNAKLVEKKEAWATRIEQKATAQAQAASPLDAADAQVTTLKMQRRTLANATQVELTRLKRDLKNAGLTEAQVHEIIPDTPAASSPTPGPAPQPAPNTQPGVASPATSNTQTGAAS